MITLDELIVKYSRIAENMALGAEHAKATGQTPIPEHILLRDVPPPSLDETVALMAGMSFAAERALEDLLELKMSLAFGEDSETSQSDG